MNIHTSSDVPDSTYFRVDECEPSIQPDGSLTLYNGEGSRRGWGRPRVTSTVVLVEPDFVAVHIGFSHKHGGGQFWRYYMTDGEQTAQTRWPSLPDELRERVLGAYQAGGSPSWAKVPGKLRSQYAKPAARVRTTYKLVEQTPNGRLVSLYDGETEYTLGRRMAQAVGKEAGTISEWTGNVRHEGGFYSYPDADRVVALWESGNLVPDSCYGTSKTLALLECQIGGRIAAFPNRKLVSTYLTPVRVLRVIQYVPLAVPEETEEQVAVALVQPEPLLEVA